MTLGPSRGPRTVEKQNRDPVAALAVRPAHPAAHRGRGDIARRHHPALSARQGRTARAAIQRHQDCSTAGVTRGAGSIRFARKARNTARPRQPIWRAHHAGIGAAADRSAAVQPAHDRARTAASRKSRAGNRIANRTASATALRPRRSRWRRILGRFSAANAAASGRNSVAPVDLEPHARRIAARRGVRVHTLSGPSAWPAQYRGSKRGSRRIAAAVA